jgi:hypothetical protein
MYGFRPQDITMLKDLPGLQEHSQPTRVNMVRDAMSTALRSPLRYNIDP